MKNELLKGTMEIELRDALTGKLKDYRKEHNLVTNAMGKIANAGLRHTYCGGAVANAIPNVYTEHLDWAGSLILFDNTIPENVNTIWAPAGVNPVGYGKRGSWDSQAGDTMLGNYQTNDEEYVAGVSIKRRWLFPSSKANGTIKCAALTSLNAGMYGYGQGVNDAMTYGTDSSIFALGTIVTQTKEGIVDVTYRGSYHDATNQMYILTNEEVGDFAIDSDNDLKYQFRVMSNKLQIIKHSMSQEKFDIFNSADQVQPYTLEEYAGTFNLGSYVHWFYNTDEQVLYFWQHDESMVNYLASGHSVTINKFDVVNKVLTQNWATFTNDQTQVEVAMPFVVTSTAVYGLYCGTQNWMGYNYLRKQSLSGGSSVQLMADGQTLEHNMVGRGFILNGRVYFPNIKINSTGYTYTLIIDTSDDTVRCSPINFAGHFTTNTSHGSGTRNCGFVVPPYANTQLLMGIGCQAGIYMNNASGYNTFIPYNYLATINNLSEPVVKTTSLDMYVTYTLSKAAEE